MHCMKCGTQLPQDANFCYKCGTPVGKTSSNPTKEQWEYCEIDIEYKENWWNGSWPARFFADAISPIKGQYVALKSREVRLKSGNFYKKDTNPLFNEFSAQLVKDGWIPTSERGEEWWQLPFRRKI